MFNFLFPLLSAEGASEGVTNAPSGGLFDGILGMLPMILIFGFLLYFMLYRPQKKQEKAVREMRESLSVGDEISTNGGIIGIVKQIKDEFIVIETGNDKTKLKLAKWAIRAIERRADDDEEEDDE